MTKVLVIGLDPYILRACERLDVAAVVVASTDQVRSATKWAELSVIRPLVVQSVENVEFVLTALRRAGFGTGSFSAAITTLESALVACASVAAALGAPFLDVEQACAFRDKSLQKDAIAAAGIPTAPYRIIDDIWAPETAVEMPWPKSVLKPVAGMGTYSTRVVEGPERLPLVIQEVRSTAILRTFMLEEFVPGSEWCFDGIFFASDLAVLSVGEYGSPCIDVATSRSALRHTKYPPDMQPRMYELGEDLVRRSAAALGLSSGAFHLEAFYDAATDTLRFSEMAARRGGGLVQEAVHCESGVDLALATVQTALGLAPDKPAPRRRLCGFAQIPAPPGTVIAIPRPSDFLARPGVEYVRIDSAPGSRMGVADNTDTRVARVLLTARTDEELRNRIDDVLGWAEDRVIVARDGSSFSELWELTADVQMSPLTRADTPRLYVPGSPPGERYVQA